MDRLSRFLSRRSVIRNRQYPSRQNTVSAACFIALMLPLIVIVLPVVVVASTIKRQKLKISVLAVDSEFAPVIELMELLRTEVSAKKSWHWVLILSRYQHKTLDALYASAIRCHIIRGGLLSRIPQQVLLLLPECVATISELRPGRSFLLPEYELQIPDDLRSLCVTTCESIGLNPSSYVAMAVYTLYYDEQRNPKEAVKHAILESHGHELTAGIDYLLESKVGVVLLGSEDTKKSRIPRSIPRLSSFGSLGGAQEVALASRCNYFWNDSDVGAWWLGLPFKRPILTTNKPRIRLKTNFTGYEHLVVPVRYQRMDGTPITFRQLLSMKSAPFKEASSGKLLMIRNSPDEIIEAHREMKARIDGTWNEDSEIRTLGERCRKVFADYPESFPMKISSYFLRKHQYLLD